MQRHRYVPYLVLEAGKCWTIWNDILGQVVIPESGDYLVKNKEWAQEVAYLMNLTYLKTIYQISGGLQ